MDYIPPIFKTQVDTAIATAIGDGASAEAIDAIERARQAVAEVFEQVDQETTVLRTALEEFLRRHRLGGGSESIEAAERLLVRLPPEA